MAKSKHIASALALPFIVAVVLTATIYFFSPAALNRLGFFGAQVKRTYVVELREDGFYPPELTTYKGDVVKFTTAAGKSFWPASNLHPTHELYPEFDPKEPIQPDASWSFRFDRVGSWKYHNHLFPVERGTIVVLDAASVEAATQQLQATLSFASCDGLPNQAQCWENIIDKTLDEKGLGAAFKVVSDLYVARPAFAASCHGFVHTLGQAAYLRYAKGETIPITQETSYCGYGFYHGFMETALLTSGNLEGARTFCEDVARRVPLLLADACWHGVGHGAEALAADDQKNQGDAQAMLDAGLTTCKNLTATADKTSRCASGVFMEFATNLIEGKYHLSINKKDPLALCRGQREENKADCYRQMQGAVNFAANHDFREAARYDERIPDDYYAAEAIETLGGGLDPTSRNFTDNVFVCRDLQSRLLTPCIKGLALAFMLRGKPGEEYKKALQFCEHTALLADEREACYELTLIEARNLYEPEKFREVCVSVDAPYRRFCTDGSKK